VAVERFEFRFAPSYRGPAAVFGVLPQTTYVEVDDDEFRVRFGLWRLRTPLANILDVNVTTDYRWVKAAGPARLSLADRGVTFATNGDRGVCVCFATPVRALDPLGLLTHPGATVTVADCDGLAAALETRLGERG
jgi:hypothetical protein